MANKKRIKRVALYIRVSTLEQANNGHSLKMQKDELEKWAKENGYIIHDYYIDDGYTATNLKRPELQRMLDESIYFDMIIFVKLDRFSRGVGNYYKIMERLEETNTHWNAIFEEYDTTTSDGQFMINIYLSMAQKEAALASERTKAVFKNRIERGECAITNLPRGYIRVKENGIAKMKINEEQAAYIREAFDHFTKYGSMRKAHLHIVNKYGLKLSRTGFGNIMKDKIYIGTYTHNEYGEFENFCDPIVSEQVFYTAQQMLKKNAKKYKNEKKYSYIFQGLIHCNKCKAKMTSASTNRKLASGKRSVHLLYRCRIHYSYHTCPNNTPVRENAIEKYLLENVRTLMQDKIISYKIEKGKQKPSNTIALEKQLKKIEKKMDGLTDLHLEGTIRKEKYEKDYRALESEQVALEIEIEKQKNAEKHFDISLYESFLEQDFETIYHTFSQEEKRRVWLSVIERIDVEKGFISPVFF